MADTPNVPGRPHTPADDPLGDGPGPLKRARKGARPSAWATPLATAHVFGASAGVTAPGTIRGAPDAPVTATFGRESIDANSGPPDHVDAFMLAHAEEFSDTIWRLCDLEYAHGFEGRPRVLYYECSDKPGDTFGIGGSDHGDPRWLAGGMQDITDRMRRFCNNAPHGHKRIAVWLSLLPPNPARRFANGLAIVVDGSPEQCNYISAERHWHYIREDVAGTLDRITTAHVSGANFDAKHSGAAGGPPPGPSGSTRYLAPCARASSRSQGSTHPPPPPRSARSMPA